MFPQDASFPPQYFAVHFWTLSVLALYQFSLFFFFCLGSVCSIVPVFNSTEMLFIDI